MHEEADEGAVPCCGVNDLPVLESCGCGGKVQCPAKSPELLLTNLIPPLRRPLSVQILLLAPRGETMGPQKLVVSVLLALALVAVSGSTVEFASLVQQHATGRLTTEELFGLKNKQHPKARSATQFRRHGRRTPPEDPQQESPPLPP